MFNSMSALPSIQYNIMTYLATSPQAEDLWKMMAYNSYDALSKPNLTMSQKLDLLWRTGPQEDYGIFFTNLVEDAIPTSKCILKIYNYYDQMTCTRHPSCMRLISSMGVRCHLSNGTAFPLVAATCLSISCLMCLTALILAALAI